MSEYVPHVVQDQTQLVALLPGGPVGNSAVAPKFVRCRVFNQQCEACVSQERAESGMLGKLVQHRIEHCPFFDGVLCRSLMPVGADVWLYPVATRHGYALCGRA